MIVVQMSTLSTDRFPYISNDDQDRRGTASTSPALKDRTATATSGALSAATHAVVVGGAAVLAQRQASPALIDASFAFCSRLAVASTPGQQLRASMIPLTGGLDRNHQCTTGGARQRGSRLKSLLF